MKYNLNPYEVPNNKAICQAYEFAGKQQRTNGLHQ